MLSHLECTQISTQIEEDMVPLSISSIKTLVLTMVRTDSTTMIITDKLLITFLHIPETINKVQVTVLVPPTRTSSTMEATTPVISMETTTLVIKSLDPTRTNSTTVDRTTTPITMHVSQEAQRTKTLNA